MSVPHPAIVQAMQRASALLQAGNFVLARTTLEQIVQSAPAFAEAHRLLAGALQALGDTAGAERSLRHAVQVDPAWTPAHASLGELLLAAGRREEGEQALRHALRGSRPYPRAALALARYCNESQRWREAAEVTAPFASAASADPDLLHQRAMALAALDRKEEAIALLRRVVASAPTNALAELHLAAALDGAEQHREAEAAARRAIAKGAGSLEARYLHARTLIATDGMDEAQAILRDIVQQRPDFADAQTNLAQLIWMRTGDAAAAAETLDAALHQFPQDDALYMIKANLLEGSGDTRGAHDLLSPRALRPDANTSTLIGASRVALPFDVHAALKFAQRAQQLAPQDILANRAVIDALLGHGEPDAAQRLIAAQLQGHPNDQYLLATQATAWRMLDDPRYRQRCNYAEMARDWTIETPAGWPDLATYLADLAGSLRQLHRLHTHPLYQSLRHGSQTSQNLMHVDDPAIRAFFTAIDAPIHRHIASIGQGPDPLRRRNTGRYRIKGIWSVRLRGQGYHTNHVHPEGWLSSACYIELPQSVLNSAGGSGPGAGAGREGWLKFGEPGIPTSPPLAAEFYIRPEPGKLALFPSYFWHGTVPFSGTDTRLTIAFDLVPA